MTASPSLALHVFLDKDGVCLRSFTDGYLPYMELAANYDDTSRAWIEAIDDEFLDDSILQLFQGLPEKDLHTQNIMCSVIDSRSSDERSFIFKSHRDSDSDFHSDSSSCECSPRCSDVEGLELNL